MKPSVMYVCLCMCDKTRVTLWCTVGNILIPINVSISGRYTQLMQIVFSHVMQWYLLIISKLISQFLVGIYKCFKLFFLCKTNIISINVNFATIHETGSSSAKIIKAFLSRESLKLLKYKLGPLISCNSFFNIALVFHCI